MCEVAMVELFSVCCWSLYLSNFGCNWWKTGEAHSLQFTTWRTLWSWLWCTVNRFV